jgi:hypothetical protein
MKGVQCYGNSKQSTRQNLDGLGFIRAYFYSIQDFTSKNSRTGTLRSTGVIQAKRLFSKPAAPLA